MRGKCALLIVRTEIFKWVFEDMSGPCKKTSMGEDLQPYRLRLYTRKRGEQAVVLPEIWSVIHEMNISDELADDFTSLTSECTAFLLDWQR